MFSNSKDFETALLNTLKAIQYEQRKFESKPPELTDIQIYDVIEYALKNNYIKGIRPHLDPNGKYYGSTKFLRLTYEGLKFIESFSE